MGANKHIVKHYDFEDWKRAVREIWDFGTQDSSNVRVEQTGQTRLVRMPQQGPPRLCETNPCEMA